MKASVVFISKPASECCIFCTHEYKWYTVVKPHHEEDIFTTLARNIGNRSDKIYIGFVFDGSYIYIHQID